MSTPNSNEISSVAQSAYVRICADNDNELMLVNGLPVNMERAKQGREVFLLIRDLETAITAATADKDKRIAELEQRLASELGNGCAIQVLFDELKAHAERMADALRNHILHPSWHHKTCGSPDALAAYRAEFPKKGDM